MNDAIRSVKVACVKNKKKSRKAGDDPRPLGAVIDHHPRCCQKTAILFENTLKRRKNCKLLATDAVKKEQKKSNKKGDQKSREETLVSYHDNKRPGQ